MTKTGETRNACGIVAVKALGKKSIFKAGRAIKTKFRMDGRWKRLRIVCNGELSY